MYHALFKNITLTLILVLLTLFCCRAQEASPITYLALGDSYTIGEAVPEGERWPVLLVDSLRQQGLKMADPDILAVTGWTTSELIEGMKASQTNFNEPYDLVSLLIGVNNQYRGYDIELYRNEFRQLIDEAVQLAGDDPGRVFVVSIPDYGVTPFGQKKTPGKIADEIDRYNSIAKEISVESNVAFVNITPVSRNALNESGLIAGDGLHPSGLMYRHWVSKIFPVAQSRLK